MRPLVVRDKRSFIYNIITLDHYMKLTKTLFTTFLGATIFAFPSVTWAKKLFDDQFERGIDAAGRGDHQAAFQFWKPLAEQGYASAQFNLGVIYDHEQGVEQDYIEAAKWYRKAAEQGHRDAQFNLGVMYSKGEGVKQDYFEAAKWYRKAAEQGHKNAQYNLGVMYYDGRGVKQDYLEAAKWYRKAADQGHINALFNLGVI